MKTERVRNNGDAMLHVIVQPIIWLLLCCYLLNSIINSDVNVIELWRQRVRQEIVTVRVSTPHSAYLSCPPGCKGNIEVTGTDG